MAKRNGGTKWTPAQRRRFQETMAAKRAAAQSSEMKPRENAPIARLHRVDRLIALLERILEVE